MLKQNLIKLLKENHIIHFEGSIHKDRYYDMNVNFLKHLVRVIKSFPGYSVCGLHTLGDDGWVEYHSLCVYRTDTVCSINPVVALISWYSITFLDNGVYVSSAFVKALIHLMLTHKSNLEVTIINTNRKGD